MLVHTIWNKRLNREANFLGRTEIGMEGRLYDFARAWAQRVGSCDEIDASAIPKVDLHCHLNGSISTPLLSHMEELQRAAQGKREEDATSPEDVDAELHPRNFKSGEGGLKQLDSPSERMKYCFTVFDNIYKVVNNLAFTRMAVQDLLLHSAAENIVLLEIRTSLREKLYKTAAASVASVNSECVSKEAYLEAVTSTVQHILNGGLVAFDTGNLLPISESPTTEWWAEFQRLYPSFFDGGTSSEDMGLKWWGKLRYHLQHRMHVRLLVSLNRSHGGEVAMEVALLAKKLQHEQLENFFESERQMCAECRTSGVVDGSAISDVESRLWNVIRRTCWVTGMDFSGYCGKNSFTEFVPALSEVRRGRDGDDGVVTNRSPLGITIHAGEKPDTAELTEIVGFAPDRWGHLVFTDPANLKTITARYDPIELCLSSNLLTGGYSSVEKHHLTQIMSAQQQEWGRNVEDVRENTPRLIDILVDGVQLAEAMRCRVKRRLMFWEETSDNEEGYKTTMANISFNTDDRGVFETSLTEELQLLLHHSTMREDCDDAALSVRALWALQRLTVPHAFTLPLELLYYVKQRHGAPNDETERQLEACSCCSCGGCHHLLHVESQLQKLSGAVCADLSCMELEWLLETFDATWGSST